jgi:hypothetical protein
MHIVNPSLSDKFLLDEILKLSKKHQCSTFIETGTHVGLSALIASDHFDKVITCENHPFYFEKAKENIKDKENISLHFQSSLELFESIFPLNEKSIIFLDAHADHDFPLLNEIKLCARNNIKPIIVIHDFYVPDENGQAKFQYDTWNGNAINLDYVYSSLCEVYGDADKFNYYYLPQQEISGVIYVEPK